MAKREENTYSEFPSDRHIYKRENANATFIDIHDDSSLTGITSLPVFKWHDIPHLYLSFNIIDHRPTAVCGDRIPYVNILEYQICLSNLLLLKRVYLLKASLRTRISHEARTISMETCP